jgi:hypothetical protein
MRLRNGVRGCAIVEHVTRGAVASVAVALVGCASGANGFGADGGDAATTSSTADARHDVAMDHVPDSGKDHGSPHVDAGHDAGKADSLQPRPDAAKDATHDAPGSVDAPHDSPKPADAGHDVAVDGQPTDASHDARVDVAVPTVDASACPNGMGTIALVGGMSTIAFGATSVNGEAWRVSPFSQDSVGAAPTVVPYGTGFLTLFSDATTGFIKSSLWSAGTMAWSAPLPVPAAGGGTSTEVGSPSLSLLGASGELVYQGMNKDYFHGVYDGSTWGVANDPVGGSAMQDTGPSPPSSATAGGVLYAVFGGTNNGLYVDTWTAAGGWTGATGVMGAGVGPVSPTVIALSGGSADLMIVYIENTTTYLKSTAHTPGSGWSTPVQVSATAIGATPVSLAPLPNGVVVMVYEGTNGLPYSSTYTPGAGTPWSSPISVYPNSLPLQSPPTVAPGVCGVDAIAALVETPGVEIVTLSSGVWSPPVLINQTSQMTYATITTSTGMSTLPDAAPPSDARADVTPNDAGKDATMVTHADAGHDASADSGTAFACSSGMGTIALLGGSSNYAFAATSNAGAAWKVTALGNDTVGAATAIVPYQGGFLGLYTESVTSYIESTLFSAGAWSSPSALSIAAGGQATEEGSPALAVLGSNAELVYRGTDDNLYHGEYSAGAWGTASDHVGDMGSPQDDTFGGATAAAAGGVLYVAYDGQNGGLYVDTWTSAGGWAHDTGIMGAGVSNIQPTMVALAPASDGGTSPDLMLVFEFMNTNFLYSTVHTPGGAAGTWGPVVQLDATANTLNPVSLAALPGGDVVLVYQGEDGYPYSEVYTSGTWSPPSSVSPHGGTVLSPPSVAPGVCGYDAVAALVEQSGVQLTALKAGAWTTPVLVTGLSGMTYASIATQP